MTPLGDIAVSVEQATGNVVPLLHEIRHALERLAETGEPTVIDLRSMPLAPGEEDAIEQVLGEGEVTATFECARAERRARDGNPRRVAGHTP